jgi:solute carrier family 25 carnitine/acylcarnitine transporter 20/29
MIVDGVAGVVGAAACVLVGHPFDTAKVVMQTLPVKHERKFETYKKTICALNNRGIVKGWYAGGALTFLGSAVANSILFVSYNRINNNISNIYDKNTTLNSIVSGGVASAITSFIICPYECLKIRIQTNTDQLTTYTRSLHMIKKEGGVRVLFKGLGATLGREVPAFMVYFTSYEICMRRFQNLSSSRDLCCIFAGGVSGILSWIISFPMDVIKTKQQSHAIPTTIRSTVSEIYSNEGLRGFFRGIAPVLIRAFPANAAFFLGVEKTKSFLNYFVN